MRHFNNITTGFIMVLGLFLSGTGALAEEESTNSSALEAPVQDDGDQEAPLPAEGEEGEVTERGVPKITIPGIGGTQTPRLKINPQKKFRLKPEAQPPQVRKPIDPLRPGGSHLPDTEGRRPPQLDLSRFVQNQVIVKLRPGMSLPSSTMASFGLQPIRTTSGGHILFRFAVPAGMEQVRNPLTVAEELAKQVSVLFAQPNRIYLPDQVPQDETHPQDPLFLQQWHYLENGSGSNKSPGGIGLPKVWKKNIRGSRNVIVAVMDTGIVGNHPDIVGSGHLLPGFDFISDLKRANDGNGRDADPTDPGDGTKLGDCIPGVKGRTDTWHGNNVAGVIGVGKTNNTEGIAGVNWEVGILPVRVSGTCGADDVDLYDAIKWSAGLPVPDAPLNQNPARIINISLGSIGLCEPLMQEAINEVVTKRGVSIVAGAGNNSGPAMFHSPSNCQNVIAVAASDEQGRLAPYSNFGPPVMIMAPGGLRKKDETNPALMTNSVLTLNHPDFINPEKAELSKGYGWEMGTSLSAPHVSGVLALWLAVNPALTHAELVKGLQDAAFPRNPNQCPRSCGAGLLNADLGPFLPLGKPVPPTPGKDIPPPPNQKEPPPVPQCFVKTTDIVHSQKIDIGNNDSQTTSAKQSLFRMMIHGDVETRREASSMIKATESGALAGIFQRNKGPVALRGQRMTPPKGWWELIPQGQLSLCLKDPAGEAPMIIYREQEMSPPVLDDMLRNAWRQCGLPNLPFPCVYQKNLGNKPQT
ncbi:MAG: S8 family peptidase, partial [Nitrospirales bacterium]